MVKIIDFTLASKNRGGGACAPLSYSPPSYAFHTLTCRNWPDPRSGSEKDLPKSLDVNPAEIQQNDLPDTSETRCFQALYSICAL